MSTTVAATSVVRSLRARRLPLAAPETQLRRLAQVSMEGEFDEALARQGLPTLRRGHVQVLQINVGKVCNQTCRHCHVDAGPDRKESMSRAVMDACLQFAVRAQVPTIDITGGAPELHPDFRVLIERARAAEIHVMDRCNLTILRSPTYQDLPAFFARNQVELVCSLPHFREYGTDRQRGTGVFAKSMEALKSLNEVGYGLDPLLRLNLVTNPVGAFLPGDQAAMEREWKRELKERYGVSFHALYALTNLPIARYLEWLEETDNLEAYLGRLERAFNPATVSSLMCRSTLSVGWDGRIYDCDFNQMLELDAEVGGATTIFDLQPEQLEGQRIKTNRHCYGCTAGAGSSCGGSLDG